MTAARFVVTGRVQGVGFRWFVRKHGLALGLRGWVRNLPDGRVEAVAAGEEGALARLEAALREGPPGAAVTGLGREPAPEPRESGFEIR